MIQEWVVLQGILKETGASLTHRSPGVWVKGETLMEICPPGVGIIRNSGQGRAVTTLPWAFNRFIWQSKVKLAEPQAFLMIQELLPDP
jgi:hypothetical protein